MHTWDSSIAYFTKDELACRCCGVVRLDLSVAIHLPMLRAQWGNPLFIGTACVCQKRNDSVQGHPHSLHLLRHPDYSYPPLPVGALDAPVDATPQPLGTLAVTLRWSKLDYKQQLELAQLAWSLGWSVGLHRSFIDIDRRKDIGVEQVVYYTEDWHFDFRKEHVRGEAPLFKPAKVAVQP